MSEKICGVCGGRLIMPLNCFTPKNIYSPTLQALTYWCPKCKDKTNIAVTDADLQEWKEMCGISASNGITKSEPAYDTKKLSIKKADKLYKPWDHNRMSSAYPDDLVRLTKLQEIMRKYYPGYKLKIYAVREKLTVADFPFDGMVQKDIEEILELGFFFDTEYSEIVMYAS